MFYNVHNISLVNTCKHFVNKNKYLYAEYILKAFLIIRAYFQNILESTVQTVKNYVLEQGSGTFSCRSNLIHGLFLTKGRGRKYVTRISLVNSLMKLVQMWREGRCKFIDWCLWSNYRIIKYTIIDNNYLNRDEKSKAKGATLKALITSLKMMKVLKRVLYHPKSLTIKQSSFYEKKSK